MSTLSGAKIKIYKVADTAEKHEFRETVRYLDKNYVLLKKLRAQPRWFSAEEIRFKEELNKFTSLGYFIFEASILRKLGISPAPNGKNWIDYRLAPWINGSYSTQLLDIVEIRPESYWRGRYTLWYVYFNDMKAMPVGNTTESPIEARETDDIRLVTEVVREY